MEWHEIEVNGQLTVRFTDLPYVPLTSSPQTAESGEFCDGKKLGGILRHGEWAWLGRNSVLQIVSLRNGQVISSYEFCESRGYENCCIKCVEEIFPYNPKVMLLAVVLESFRGTGGVSSYIAIYSVEQSGVLNSIELSLHLTCARFMESSACRRSLLQNFDGCLAVGSEEGVIVLLDLNMRKLTSMRNKLQEDNFVPCHIVDYSLSLTEIHRNFRQCQQAGIHFGLQMEVIESPCPIQCILPIDLILGLAIGLEDGRLALYDLAELQILYIALPNPEVTMSALIKMDFLEPPDDPRPCLYIWTLHENGENLHAVLHSLNYEKRVIEEDESAPYFESFQTSSVRLQLPLEATQSVALSCQAISTFSTYSEDDSNCLCVISWLSVLEGKNKLLIFDLNQWYKEEMPFVLEYGKQPNYLAGYILNGECTGLHTFFNPDNIAHFNSMQRFEEHFHPNSLSFESLLLHTQGCRRYNWEGVQNRVINLLRSSNAAIFLEPNFYFNEIIRTRLMPQFVELNINSTFSRNAKYEILLSAALEHNCVGLLRDCAKSWIDGSFMGNFSISTGLSLSTLTDWIWKRATCIKSRCNDLCKSLFECGGYPLDSREQKELCFITRQLKLLADLMQEILIYAKRQIPERVYHDLESKHSSLCMASSYQDILLWLLNIGLLPEASSHNVKINASNILIPYPYKELNEFYTNKRSIFAKFNENFISKKSGSCKLLFIDSFIEHVCKGNSLHEFWLENEGNGLYPPNSLEAMLRVMLVPDLDYDDKCAILLYFFLDLNMVIDEEVYKDVVANFIKFPSVFKLSASLIKTVQAFWNLDHDQYLPAVDEFISPFNKNQCYPQWQVELFIEVLLNQKSCNLALRVLESQPSLISPLLKLNTLLANELISEAFHFVRSINDDALLETFFTRCLCNGQFGVIRDLALSEQEGLILQTILKKSKAPGAESLHFVYLLQRSKYIEAVSYMDEMSNNAKAIKNSLHQTSQMDGPNLVLSAFNTTMTPVTQGLTDIYFRIKNKIKKKEASNKSPVPLSCQLIKQNANSLLGGIYHSSALSAHFATYYWGEMEEQRKPGKHFLNSNNAPFLRRPQIDTICTDYLEKNNISYPQVYTVTEKRTLIESGVVDNEPGEFERQKIEHKLNPKKKRRLIGQEIVDDLSHFMKMNKTSQSLNVSEFTFGPEQISEPLEQKRKDSVDLLTKPVRREKESEEVTTTPVPEIHGILKTHTPEPNKLQREPLVEEEKYLRFRLPSTDVSTTQVYVEATQGKVEIDHMEIEQEEKPEGHPRQKCKQTTRAVSEESNNSSVCSGNISEENFYSPLSSQNNSKLDSPNLSRYSFISGPQPRKPLARLSAEPSEKSLTPEPVIKPTDGNSINKSSGLDYATAQVSTRTFKISPRNSIQRLCTDRLQEAITTDDMDRKSSSTAAYVTANEILSSSLKQEVTATNSGFGNIVSFETFAGSKINEFSPKVSSSKVVKSPTEAVEENSSFPAKLSECSTVLGPLTTFDCSNTGAITPFAIPSGQLATNKPTEEQKCQMLETTLSMSTYEFTMLDSTSPQQTISAKESESPKADEKKEIELPDNGKEESKCETQLNENMIEIQKQSNTPDHSEESNYDCIVLSSSSSSACLSLEQEEYNDSNNYSDNESEEEDEVGNDNIEYDEDSEIGESDDSDMSNEDIDGDYDEEDNNEELSIEDIGNSNDTEDENVIQLLDDSSSADRWYCGESNTDDVKESEEVQPLVSGNNNKVLVSKEEEKSVNATKISSEDNPDVNELKLENKDDVIGKSLPTQANKLEKEDSNASENSAQLSVTTNNPSDFDAVSTSTSQVISEKKSEDLKQTSSSCGGLSEEPDLMNTGTESCSSQVDTEGKSSNSRNNTAHIGVVEGTGDESMALKMTDSTNDSEVKIQNQSEIICTAEVSAGDPVKENSEAIIEAKILSEPSEEKEDSNVKELEDGITHTSTSCKLESATIAIESSEAVEDAINPIIKETVTPKVEIKSDKKELSEEKAKNEDLKVKEIENDGASKFTSRKRTNLKGSSVPPIDFELKDITAVSSPRRNTRGISVPAVTINESEEFTDLMPRSRRIRASSLQPKYKMEDIDIGTTNKGAKTQDTEECLGTIATSLPLCAVDSNMSIRHRPVLLDAINEDPVSLDSPSTRTRSRLRLNSMDSELDSPIVRSTEQLVQSKRTRRSSISNNTIDLPLTPKRTRHNSFTSQPEKGAVVTTPRNLRGRSVLSMQEEDTESIPASPKPVSNKRIGMKRKKSTNEETTIAGQDKTSPKSDQSAVSDISYSSSRRLTRTQLAIMEKSAALYEASTKDAISKEADVISPPPNKRTTRSRSTRSSNFNADSDDAESVSSKLSTTSSVTATKRRVTRKFLKEKDEVDVDDDRTSVASSFGSEKHQLSYRLKDKNSPNTTLSAIPEDAPIETVKRGRPTKR